MVGSGILGGEPMSLDVSDWVFPAGSFTTPGRVFVGAHHGAGTTMWASLLEEHDGGLVVPEEGEVIGVCRSTPAGISAAKTLIGQHGPRRFSAFLVVADAPGRTPERVRRDVKVLAGAVTVIQVPWMPVLRGAQVGDPLKPGASKGIARIRTQLSASPARVKQSPLTQEK